MVLSLAPLSCFTVLSNTAHANLLLLFTSFFPISSDIEVHVSILDYMNITWKQTDNLDKLYICMSTCCIHHKTLCLVTYPSSSTLSDIPCLLLATDDGEVVDRNCECCATICVRYIPWLRFQNALYRWVIPHIQSLTCYSIVSDLLQYHIWPVTVSYLACYSIVCDLLQYRIWPDLRAVHHALYCSQRCRHGNGLPRHVQELCAGLTVCKLRKYRT